MPDPLVSVIVPTYNRPALLERALKSIEAQTLRDYEVIVVNDAGPDVSEIAGRYSGMRYYKHPSNRGLPAARNTGIIHARGHYLAYLDDDDWYYPNHLQVLAAGIRGYRAAYTSAHFVYSEDRQSLFAHDYSYQALLQNNLFPCNAVLHERSLIDEVGGFDESLPNHEDWDLWLRIGKVTEFVHVEYVTCAVDRTGATMSSRTDMMGGYNAIRMRYKQAST